MIAVRTGAMMDEDIQLTIVPRGTQAEHRERRANVHRLFLDYIRNDAERGASLTERDENTDKITVIRPHPDMEERLIRAALITHFMRLTKRQRDVWLAVEFGVVRDKGTDGQWCRRWLYPDRKGGLTLEEVGDYYNLMVSSVREYHKKAQTEMAKASDEVRLD